MHRRRLLSARRVSSPVTTWVTVRPTNHDRSLVGSVVVCRVLVGEQRLPAVHGYLDGTQRRIGRRLSDIAGVGVERRPRWCGATDVGDHVEVGPARYRRLAGSEHRLAETAEEAQEGVVVDVLSRNTRTPCSASRRRSSSTWRSSSAPTRRPVTIAPPGSARRTEARVPSESSSPSASANSSATSRRRPPRPSRR